MKTLALSTAIVTLATGVAFAQTPPTSSDPTTGTGQQQAPMTGQEAAPTAPDRDVGNEGGAPAIDSQTAPATPPTPETTTNPDTAATPDTGMGDTASSMTPPEGYSAVMVETLNADMLMDADIYDSEDSSVGTVSAVMPETGAPEQVIVDVGGFLGLGAKPVALNVSELSFFKQTDGDEVRGYTTMTEDQLKDLPEHEG